MPEYIPASRPACQHPYFLTVKRKAPGPGWALVDYAYIPVEEDGVPEACWECNNQGHNVYLRALDTAGNYISGANVVVESLHTADQLILGPRGSLDYCFDAAGITYYGAAFPMAGGGDSSFSTDRGEVGPYNAHMLGNSDALFGMGMPSNRHVQFILTFQRVEEDGEEPDPPDPPDPPQEDSIVGNTYRVKRADAQRIVLVRVG